MEKGHNNKQLETELAFLRSQINPHFIFNVLNSAVAMARTGSDQLESLLIKLSNLMRYMLYTTDEQKVPLAQEVEQLENYIDLQKIRFGEDVSITFTASGTFSGQVIEPMLLIPFVENAFKHGTGLIDRPAISVDIKEEGQAVHFRVKNRFDGAVKPAKGKNSGIGLANVKKRLQLLYDDKYSLDVKKDGDWFDTTLNLVLK